MKVALVHFWLVGMRGGERVLEALCKMYPGADIFTHVYDPAEISNTIKSHKITTTFINKLPRAKTWYQNYLPLMPWALAELDFSDYDLIISSESGPAKGILTPPDAAHICYCHSPMRYVWDMYAEYTKELGWFKRVLAAPAMNYLRLWDAATANGPDVVVANSNFIAQRVKKCWGRASEVVHPPVAVEDFKIGLRETRKNFYLFFGELVAYKKADLAVRAFSRPDNNRELVVIGSGAQLEPLKKIASPNIKFLGRQPFNIVKQYLSSCKALIFPGLEDFGIVPVEALASGTPVIAYGRGGVLDTIKDGKSGIFFHKQTQEDLLEALCQFERAENSFDPGALAEQAKKFATANFQSQMQAIINRVLQEKGKI